MDLKIFDFGTLNEKDRPFLLEDNELSVAENVMRDNAGNLVTRSGFIERITLPSNVVEVVYYRSKNEYVVFSNPSNNHLRIDIYNADTYALKRTYAHTGQTGQRLITQFGSVGQITEINYTEFQNNIYFIYIVGGNPAPILKYDGYVIRSVGLPQPKTPTYSTGGVNYSRLAYRSVDFNNNITYGPYTQISGLGSPYNITIATIADSDYGFIGYSNYAKCTSGTDQTINSSNRTINNLTHNFVANDFIFISQSNNLISNNGYYLDIVTPKNKDYLILEVESVTATSITIKSSSFSSSEEFIVKNNAFLDSSISIIRADSVNSDFGYELISPLSIGPYKNGGVLFENLLVSSTTQLLSMLNTNTDVLLENIYDSTTFKYRPPLCKYIASYGDQLAFGNIIGIWVESNNFVQYNNNDLIMYSDISDGDSGENISRINRQLIGESFDGQVTGLCRVRDSLIITKDNAIFSIDGQLYSGGYSLRKIETNNIGCKSTKSFLQIEGGVTFHGNDGLYFMNSYNAKKISEKMDPFFMSDIDITKTRSVVRFANDQHLYYIKKTDGHYFVVFDFNYKRWFKWKAINASCGIFSKPDGEVFFSDGVKIYELGGLSTDNGTNIASKFKTKYIDLGSQNLIKKFIKCRVLDMIGGGPLSVSVYRDWSNTPIVAESPLVVDLKTKHKYIPLTNGVSCAIEFTNSTSDMIISGLIIEIEPWQVSDRNN